MLKIYFFFLFLSLFLFPGCDWQKWKQRVVHGNQILWSFFFESEPQYEENKDLKNAQEGLEKNSLLSSSAARASKENAELFYEIFLVLFDAEPKNAADFGSWVDTLNQGASLEGVYRGLILSEQYQKLEKQPQTASVKALQIFSEELADLESELPEPTDWESKPLPPLQKKEFSKVYQKKDKNLLKEEYARYFITYPFFKLKRILADEALKLIEFKKSHYLEQLALWYSLWAVRVLERNVSFGVELRSRSEASFHYQWALKAPPDRLQWEVLNRLHRIMNQANRER